MKRSDKKGTFFLGGQVRPSGESLDKPFSYDASDLTTHAVCVGMTGSGKTGLGITIIEEAVLNGIPALVVDPKGDMTNLLLSFPDLLPSDFRPWVDVDEARRKDLSLDEYADEVAGFWRKGLARWGIGKSRIARYKEGAEFTIFTPGSDAGASVSIMQSLQAPSLGWNQDAEILREMLASTVSALLALIDVESDPVTGREHILLSTLIEQSWREGQDMDLSQLIVQVQKPPFDQLGVLPLEVFYPEKERMELTLALNGLLASPRFASWLEGEPLSVQNLLWTTGGHPRVSIFSLAHLSDAEKSFFLTLLLEQVRVWLRLQEGTPSLRALLYIDELYGFMPPYPANPPTKMPLLTLLKQARALGLGLVLSTQNPIDLDYKGLSNAGTWFIGKLQTENDRERVLEGLRGASLGTDKSLDQVISNLGKRTFLLNSVHTKGTILFGTRHAMCYLRGPLTRKQIRQLVGDDARGVARPVQPARPASPAAPQAPRVAAAPEPAPATAEEPASPWAELPTVPPVLPSGISQYFVSPQISLEWAIRAAETGGRKIVYRDKQLVYRAALLGRARVRIDNTTHKVHEQLTISRVVTVPEDNPFIAWDAEPVAVDTDELDSSPAQGACFESLPSMLGDARRLSSKKREFTDHVYRQTAITLSHHRALKLTARTDESEEQFKRRCRDEAEEKRDAEVRKLEKRYETQFDRLEKSIRREERELESDKAEYDARKREELISAGESVFTLLSGRRRSSALSTASRRRRMTQQSKADVKESEEELEDLQSQLDELLDELEQEKDEVESRWAEVVDDVETVQVRPRRADVFVEAWGVAWVPYWEVLFDERGTERQLALPAFESGEDSGR